MKKYASFLVVGLVLGFSGFARADKESWYWQFALGYSFPQYPSDVKASADSLKAAGGSNLPIYVDLGFYWPILDGNTIIGPALTATNDSYSFSGVTVGIIQSGAYFSMIHTFGDEPGHGLFLRGDVGIARVGVNYSGSGFTVDSYSKAGLGLGGHVGYGIMIGQDTRLLFSTHYNLRLISGQTYGEFGIAIGPNF